MTGYESDHDDDYDTGRGIMAVFKHERQSRLGSASSILGIIAAGFVTSVIVIVPGRDFARWTDELKSESLKQPVRTVEVLDRAFGLRQNICKSNNPGNQSDPLVMLTSYDVVREEYEYVWGKKKDSKHPDEIRAELEQKLKKGGRKSVKPAKPRKSLFFIKNWGLILVQNAEEMEHKSDEAKGACQLQTRTGGRRFLIWPDKDVVPFSSDNVPVLKKGVLKKRKKSDKLVQTGEDCHDYDDEEVPAKKKQVLQNGVLMERTDMDTMVQDEQVHDSALDHTDDDEAITAE